MNVSNETKSGLYICKTYWVTITTEHKEYIDKNGIVAFNIKYKGKLKPFPVLKFGRTKNIDTRMYYYNRDKNKSYKLLAFFPVKKHLKWREDMVKGHWYDEHFRMSQSEHIPFESGEFKYMVNALQEEATRKYIHHRKPNPFSGNLEPVGGSY